MLQKKHHTVNTKYHCVFNLTVKHREPHSCVIAHRHKGESKPVSSMLRPFFLHNVCYSRSYKRGPVFIKLSEQSWWTWSSWKPEERSIQAVLIPSSPEMEIWSQSFAVESKRQRTLIQETRLQCHQSFPEPNHVYLCLNLSKYHRCFVPKVMQSKPSTSAETRGHVAKDAQPHGVKLQSGNDVLDITLR